MRLSGVGGSLTAGARLAATLGKWRAVVDKHWPPFEITAHVERRDDFWLSQRPLSVVLIQGRAKMSWKSSEVSVSDGLVTIGVQGRPVMLESEE
jgi:hypothetical protein